MADIGRPIATPSWYRAVWAVAALALAAGVVAIMISYTYLSGEPESAATADLPDPTWTLVLGGVGLGLLFVGLLVLLAPTAHQLLTRRRP